jgi:uncharacterized protein (DUF1499 family)
MHQNWADTTPPSHPDLGPLTLGLPAASVWQSVLDAIRSLPRWRIESQDESSGIIRATRRTRLFRFVDDVTIRVETLADGARVHARSQSRVGKGDLGQNRRNLLEFFAAVKRHMGRSD